MKKILLFTLINCLMVFAVVPMNIGNKWWYKYNENGSIQKKTFKVEKDTLVNTFLSKKIRVNLFNQADDVQNSVNIVSSNYQIWTELNGCFYIGNQCYYNPYQADTSWSYGGDTWYTEYINNHITIFFNQYYSTQTRSKHYDGSGIGGWGNSAVSVCNGLGLYNK